MGTEPNAKPAGDAALQRIAALLRSDPSLALREATTFLASAPGHPLALLFLGMARRQIGDLAGAAAILGALAQRRPDSAAVQYELGVTLGFDLTERLQATFGYTFMYWSRVARPGDR